MYMELATDDNAAAEFMKGIMPKGLDLSDSAVKEKAKELGIEVPKTDNKEK